MKSSVHGHEAEYNSLPVSIRVCHFRFDYGQVIPAQPIPVNNGRNRVRRRTLMQNCEEKTIIHGLFNKSNNRSRAVHYPSPASHILS